MNTTSFDPLSELVPGAVIASKYTLVSPLGVGGMGAVWVARNEATGADVALKLLLHRAEDDVEPRARFRREAHATARLSHRGIVRVYDLVELPPDGDRIGIVMELLHGRTLAAHLDDHGKLPLDEALAITLQLLSALSHAHGAGIIHRDLKPENVFLQMDADGVVTPKILDFGISKLRLPKVPIITREGEMLGTPSYMSPEQVRGRSTVDARSDLFNVGILLYEMLTGKNPFAGDGLHSVIVAILEDEPPPILDVPEAVWRVIARALEKSPGQRFASANELAAALRGTVGIASPPSLRPDSSGEVRLSWAPASSGRASLPVAPKRWPLVASAAAAAAVAAVAAATLALWTTEVPRPPAHGVAPSAVMAAERTPLAANGADVPEAPPAARDLRDITVPTTAPVVVPPKPPVPRPRRVYFVRDPGF